ncbi:MAG: MobP2 family relaxase, partial [Oscillospiraceae bacterium]
MVGVILKCRFIVPGSKKFRAYIDYISRTEAVRSEHFSKYSAYVGEYMDDRDKQNFVSEKVSALFTRTKNNLTQKEKEALQKQFETAQKNLSPMWQNVISFDNRFLQEHGIYDQRTNFFDEEKLQSVTRQAMEKMLQNENMGSSAIWSASVHFNTDNLHIHIAVAEPYPTRPLKNFTIRDREGQKKIVTQYKAALKPGTLDKMKSQVVNAIVDRSEHLKKINDLIRDNLVGTVKNDELYANRKFKKQY